jgi:hypothetical protein
MSTSAKQISTVTIALYAYNGDYRIFTGYPKTYKVWNSNFVAESDFQGSSTVESLTGFERGGLQGYRSNCRIDLDNTYKTDALDIQNLLDDIVSQMPQKRTIFTGTPNVISGFEVTLPSSASAVAQFYKGFEITDGLGNTFIITNYTSGRVATLSGEPPVGWDNVVIYIKPPDSMNTIVRISPTASVGDGEFYNLTGSTFGVNRQLTVGSQVITLNFRGVERKFSVSNNMRIG